ncbi:MULTISPECIES: chromosome segregation protein SMC [Methylomicrobium]|uniref:Chromosome partition protein Smc n=1 Tax=Methylomicrobium album BG8 TaxID=686340 RepID=H8GNM4_METAL|nr:MULTISPECIES: chromosome segregation protein SMC [Methylomicrobium]EIC29617.1 chromosome segregation protein SMC [Methylomicrobium album BG8]
MRLEKIKLAGFKSFVDPTTIPITGNLTAIVGPNGCGKSNIIDAVRWVMGESSAKHLRGGNMADVIFNGSATRKPIGTASVELIFDNTEGKLGGEYANYSTISIKRQVSRDGQSQFTLNGSKCRRKDITDIFLGTGLGARSYAIIEQGTISRVVEAKPEDLRLHIEEAAGISKYKERRQETESRMQNTRENLERLQDLRDEVEKQLKHLQKQAEKAEKYTELKKQERQFKLELLAMRWQSYQAAAAALESAMQEAAHEHNRVFVELRALESALESKRGDHKNQQHNLNKAQGDYYSVVAEVGSLEQAIRHNEQSHRETETEIDRVTRQAEQAQGEIDTDREQLETLKQAKLTAEEALQIAEQRQEESLQWQQGVQQKQSDWQAEWEVYRTESARYQEQAEVERVKSRQLQNQNRQLQARRDQLQAERDELSGSELEDEIEALAEEIDLLETDRAELHEKIEAAQRLSRDRRDEIKSLHDTLHKQRAELHGIRGKITSLELLQQHAMGKDNKKLNEWLNAMQLGGSRRLAECLDVQPGWETAVETVLGGYLEAICVEDAQPVVAELPRLQGDSLALFETGFRVNSEALQNGELLTAKVKASWDLNAILAGIHCAEDTASARHLALSLKPYESVITPDGAWFGPGWIRIIRAQDSKAGVLQRERELRQLKQRQEELQAEIAAFEERLETAEDDLKTAERSRDTLQQEDKTLQSRLTLRSAEHSAKTARFEQQQRRIAQLRRELEEIDAHIAENAELIAESVQLMQEAEQTLEKQAQQKHQLESASQDLSGQQKSAEQRVHDARQKVFALKTQIESLLASENHTAKQIERLELQCRQLFDRKAELEAKLQDTLKPIDEEKQQLQELTLDRERLDKQLKTQRALQEQVEADISRFSQEQVRLQNALEKRKEALDKIRYELQESRVRQQTVNEQLTEIEADADEVLKQLREGAEESAWKQKVDELARQIERLGAINLTAIEEFKAQTERMNFLNAQHADLTEALQTLELAISKIDKESRLRFKETFDKINGGLQEKFPKLFGGGQAYLELSEEDLLESGVNIIARPPGKRNSSIHLLSGGEKALTAVALVFSIFDLNPAPFCLLDEVDAPLDDANVGRFSKMVEEMSSSVQFLYISHNKATMEIAHQLAGVTMKEPGVSRMVAVDLEEAVSLAET